MYWVGYNHFTRVDFVTDEIRAFTRRQGAWYDGIYTARASAITNDGRWVFMDDGASIIDTSATCGVTVDPMFFGGQIDSNYIACPEKYINIKDTAGYDDWHQYFSLFDDENEATYIMSSYPYSSLVHPIMRVTMRVKKPTKIFDTYLSLGDSYTSGQGDTEKASLDKSYYLPGTEGWNGCRISSRAYPYTLKAKWGVADDDMHNVSCSGARLVMDYNSRMASYYGQNRQLTGLDASSVQKNRTDALEKDVAGVVPRIEFVKKYHPDVITFTGGGNDVGFADILKYCASSVETCRFVESKSKTMHDDLMAMIDDQYLYTKRFISDVQKVTPSTKIYVIGYPRFIYDDSICGLNAALLSQAEARFINESVDRLNGNLAKAAKEAGVVYLDVSDALSGGRICEGSRYVTDFVAAYANSQRIDSPDMFHPNATGHEKIAEAILKAKENYEKGVLPSIPIFTQTLKVNTVIRQSLTNEELRKGSKVTLKSERGTFNARSRVKVVGYSEQVMFGEVIADDDGVAEWSGVILEDMSSGFHLLTMTGEGIEVRSV